MTSSTTKTRAAHSYLNPLVTALLVVLLAVVAALGLALHRRPGHHAALDVEAESAATPENTERRGRTTTTLHGAGAPTATIDETERRRSEARQYAKTSLDVTRFTLLNEAQAYRGLGIEGVGNSMMPYLRGMLTAIRQLNPMVIPELRDALAERTCDHEQTDEERMLTADMILTEGQLGSLKAVDCSLRARKGEDVVLWKMLDAWIAAGQPKSAVVETIEASATDPRTVRRLSGGEDMRRQQFAEAERIASEESLNQGKETSDVKPRSGRAPTTEEGSRR